MRAQKAQLPLKLDPVLVDAFRARCKGEGRTMSGTVGVLIARWLDGRIRL